MYACVCPVLCTVSISPSLFVSASVTGFVFVCIVVLSLSLSLSSLLLFLFLFLSLSLSLYDCLAACPICSLTQVVYPCYFTLTASVYQLFRFVFLPTERAAEAFFDAVSPLEGTEEGSSSSKVVETPNVIRTPPLKPHRKNKDAGLENGLPCPIAHVSPSPRNQKRNLGSTSSIFPDFDNVSVASSDTSASGSDSDYVPPSVNSDDEPVLSEQINEFLATAPSRRPLAAVPVGSLRHPETCIARPLSNPPHESSARTASTHDDGSSDGTSDDNASQDDHPGTCTVHPLSGPAPESSARTQSPHDVGGSDGASDDDVSYIDRPRSRPPHQLPNRACESSARTGSPNHVGSSGDTSDDDALQDVIPTGVFYRVAPKSKAYDTVNACLFCCRLIKQKMRRHLKAVHSGEHGVAEALAGTHKQQDARFSLLISRGNYEHNVRILTAGAGEIILKRRPKKAGIPIREFLPCPGCLSFMIRRDLLAHHQVCPGASDEGLELTDLVTKAENLLSRFIPGEVPDFVKEIQGSEIRDVICADRTLIMYATYTLECKGRHENHIKTIKARLIKLARLLIEMRAKTGKRELSLQDMCNAKYFDQIVMVTKEAAGFDPGTTLTPPTFRVPTVPRTIGTSLGKICHTLIGVSMREDNPVLGREVKIFKKLLENEWGDRMGRASQATLNLRKQRRDKDLPTTEDMKRLQTHLQGKLTSAVNLVKSKPSVRSYNKLLSVTAVSLMVFNKRRGGESMKIRLSDYTDRVEYAQNTTVIKSLSALEKEIMGRMTLIKTRGKRGRTVPVIIPQLEKEAIDLMVSLREFVGLRSSNTNEAYLFSRAPDGRAINGWYQLRKECVEAGCEKVQNITSTSMRKYLATVVQIMNLSENEKDQIASHLGHDLAVHRKYYRLSESTVELSKVAKLLLSTEDGLATSFDADPPGV